MGILDFLPNNKKKRPERIRVRQRDQPQPDNAASNAETVINLVRDETIAPANPLNAVNYFGEERFRNHIKTSSVFFYGKVWFYNAVMEILLGADWNKSKEIQIVHYAKTLTNSTQRTKKIGKPLVVLPSVHDQITLNILVSKALETKRPVWFVGYPSTLSKHLLVSFQSFFLCDASSHEIEILSDVAELSSQDVDFLKKQKRAVFISKGNAQSIHLTF